jgi:hypothetical protein
VRVHPQPGARVFVQTYPQHDQDLPALEGVVNLAATPCRSSHAVLVIPWAVMNAADSDARCALRSAAMSRSVWPASNLRSVSGSRSATCPRRCFRSCVSASA